MASTPKLLTEPYKYRSDVKSLRYFAFIYILFLNLIQFTVFMSKSGKDFHYNTRICNIEVACGFVGKEKSCTGSKASGNGNTLLLAAE